MASMAPPAGRADLIPLILAHLPVMCRTLEGVVLSWSDGLAELTGYNADEAVGSTAHLLLRTRFSRPLAEIQAVLARDGRWSGTLSHLGANGAALDVYASWLLAEWHEQDVVVEYCHQPGSGSTAGFHDLLDDAFAIAHSVNQPLTAAMNYLAVARQLLAGAGQGLAVLDKAALQVERAGEIAGAFHARLTAKRARAEDEGSDLAG